MGIPIDQTKLKLKYELKVHRKTKTWPDAEAVLYEVARYLEFQDTNIIKKQKQEFYKSSKLLYCASLLFWSMHIMVE